ncbi:hypothetical protein FRB99_002422 [Tulasnella sp. 403]|nr:hypothetical protein FRB99_002422 [Tulasnella sp. 403]
MNTAQEPKPPFKSNDTAFPHTTVDRHVSLNLSSFWVRKWKPYLLDLYQRNLGLLFIATSTLMASLMLVVVKLMNNDGDVERPHVPTLELIAFRMVLTWILCESWMHYDKVPDPFLGPKGVRRWLVLRGVSGFVGLFGLYYSVQYLSLSDCTTIGFLTPFVTAFLGKVLLKEPFGRKEGYAAIVSFLGVILIARPSFLFEYLPTSDDSQQYHDNVAGSADHGVAVGIANGIRTKHSETMRLTAIGLVGVCGVSLAFVSMRRVGSSTHVMHSAVYFSAWCFIVSVFGMLIFRVPWIAPPDFKWTAGLVTIGMLGFIAQTLVTKGFQLECAGRGSLALYVQIVFSLLFEKVVFHHQPTALSLLGTVVIISSAAYVAVSKPPATQKSAVASDEEVGLMAMVDGEGGAEGDTKETIGPYRPVELGYRVRA